MVSLRDKRRIHETVVKDILDVLHTMQDHDTVQMVTNRNRSKVISSISNASSNLVLTFPVLCSNTLDISNASMISKAIERKCVTMMQLLLSACNLSDTADMIEYLGRFHNNMNSDFTVDDFVDTMEKLTDESAIDIDPSIFDIIREDMHCLDYTLQDSINETSIVQFMVDDSNASNRYMVTLEAPLQVKNTRVFQTGADAKRMADISTADKNETEYFNKMLLDNDVKKANELVPSMMVVRVYSPSGAKESGGKALVRQFVIGIKAKLIPLDSYDIIDRIKVKNEDHKGLLKFLRATTREISFFKDFLFAVDRAKLDALSYSKKSSNSKIWKMLERRALKGNFRTGLSMVNDSQRIATLVITQEEVEYLKKDGVDIDHGSSAKVIMEAYGLMGFVIVNESLEVARFLFDDDSNSFEDISFRSLERESSNNEYRKIVNLMTKMR